MFLSSLLVLVRPDSRCVGSTVLHVSCYTIHVSRLLSRVWIVAGAVMAASGWVAGLALDSLTDKADVWWTICLVRARGTWLDTLETRVTVPGPDGSLHHDLRRARAGHRQHPPGPVTCDESRSD